MTRIRLFLASLLLLSLCCCGKSERPQEKAVHDSIPGTASAPQQKLKIALVLKTLTNPYFAGIEKGARRAEQEFGVDLQVKTGSQETAIEQQIQIVEELIELKVDAIVITPGDLNARFRFFAKPWMPALWSLISIILWTQPCWCAIGCNPCLTSASIMHRPAIR